MKTLTCSIILVAAAASAPCAAQAPGTVPAAARASSAPAQVTSGALQISSAPVQITLAPPRGAPAASPSDASATQNVLPGALPELHGTRGNYAGYTRVVISGQELYCRNDVATGSRTERHTVCLTPAQWRAQQARAQTYIQNVQRSGGLGGVNVGGMSPTPMTMH
ncbi:MAG TPA: hypothetical protein VK727_00725 [Steroidobacteraceae bacterium]|jgi:hypothetical protein|nr:hypothetical protein [Steroidobacteraceae bacterium]